MKTISFSVVASGACIVSTESNILSASVAPAEQTYIMLDVGSYV